MTFEEYHELAMRTAGKPFYGKDAMMLSALGLAGESGEVIDHIKKVIFHGHRLDHGKIREELGDLLWYIARMGKALGIDMEIIAIENIEKLKRRYPEGFSSERSINRED